MLFAPISFSRTCYQNIIFFYSLYGYGAFGAHVIHVLHKLIDHGILYKYLEINRFHTPDQVAGTPQNRDLK